MIELPSFASPGAMSVTLIDAGFTQRGVQSLARVDRKGSRYRLALSYGPYHPDQARVMIARLLAGKQEGIRVPLPILHSQGSPGIPLLSAAVSTGKVIAIDGLTPGYFCKEGFWLSLVKDGQHFLHNVKTGGRADASGTLSITLNEMVRDTLPDDAVVNLAKPMIEGIVVGDEAQWAMAVDGVTPIEFEIEEAK